MNEKTRNEANTTADQKVRAALRSILKSDQTAETKARKVTSVLLTRALEQGMDDMPFETEAGVRSLVDMDIPDGWKVRAIAAAFGLVDGPVGEPYKEDALEDKKPTETGTRADTLHKYGGKVSFKLDGDEFDELLRRDPRKGAIDNALKLLIEAPGSPVEKTRSVNAVINACIDRAHDENVRLHGLAASAEPTEDDLVAAAKARAALSVGELSTVLVGANPSSVITATSHATLDELASWAFRMGQAKAPGSSVVEVSASAFEVLAAQLQRHALEQRNDQAGL